MVKRQPVNAGDIRDLGFTPGLGRSPGGGHGNPLQYSCLEESPSMEESGQQLSTGSQRVGCDKWLTMHTCKDIYKP